MSKFQRLRVAVKICVSLILWAFIIIVYGILKLKLFYLLFYIQDTKLVCHLAGSGRSSSSLRVGTQWRGGGSFHPGVCKGIKIHFPLMSYGSETPNVWSTSAGSEVSPYGPLWDAPPAPVPYPDILAFPPADLVWSAAGCGRGGSRAPPGGKKPRRRVASVAQRRAANIRERRRMFNLNEAFDKLRRKVPTFAYEKRLSRIETLRLAITYISFMCELLHGSPQPHHPPHAALHPPRHVFDAEVPWCA